MATYYHVLQARLYLIYIIDASSVTVVSRIHIPHPTIMYLPKPPHLTHLVSNFRPS